MEGPRVAVLVVAILMILPTATPPPCMGQVAPCAGKYKGGLEPSAAEMKDILKNHLAWVKDGGWGDRSLANDPRRARLCGARLMNADLSRADLVSADLRDTDFIGANLSGANLISADLTDALLIFADLQGADLMAAHLSGAKLNGADLSGAYLDFDPDYPPKALDTFAAQNLQLVRFHYEPAGLVRLRAEFESLGLRTQQAQLTYAIRRAELNVKNLKDHNYVHNRSERVFNTVFFDWPC